MSYEAIRVTPVTPHIGAEISEIDLTKPLSNRQVMEVHDALIEHQVIFFRDQPINFEQHKAFGRHFGELHVHTGFKGEDEHPEIRHIYGDEKSTHIAGERWHSDQTCTPIPPLGSILHMHEVPPDGGGDTLFASMYAAYDALSPQMKRHLEGLTAFHDGARAFGRYAGAPHFQSLTSFPTANQPVIAKHPVSGRKLLFVNHDFTVRINELPEAESEALLAYLIAHCREPEFIVRFRWRKNSIAFWDNRCTQHRAVWDYYPHRRSGFRVQIKGTCPIQAA